MRDATEPRRQVAVYHDEGTGELTRACLLFALARVFAGRATLRRIYAAELVGSDDWHKDTALLAFPGGADAPYCRKLDGAGTRSIRRYLEAGGAFLGVCAGAYYACARIAFETGSARAVSGPRELALFPGTARGSLHELAAPYATDHLRCAAQVCVRDVHSAAEHHTLYWGGPEFLPDPGATFTPVLRYVGAASNDALAAVYVPVGNGRALLTGIHAEVMGCQLAVEVSRYPDDSFTHGMRVSQQLSLHERERDALFRLQLSELGF